MSIKKSCQAVIVYKINNRQTQYDFVASSLDYFRNDGYKNLAVDIAYNDDLEMFRKVGDALARHPALKDSLFKSTKEAINEKTKIKKAAFNKIKSIDSPEFLQLLKLIADHAKIGDIEQYIKVGNKKVTFSEDIGKMNDLIRKLTKTSQRELLSLLKEKASKILDGLDDGSMAFSSLMVEAASKGFTLKGIDADEKKCVPLPHDYSCNRDFMAKQLISVCKKHDKVLALVGLSHSAISKIIEKADKNIKICEYFPTDYSASDSPINNELLYGYINGSSIQILDARHTSGEVMLSGCDRGVKVVMGINGEIE